MTNRNDLPWVPRLRQPSTISVGTRVGSRLKSVMEKFRPKPISGRNDRFAQLVFDAVESSVIAREAQRVGGLGVTVEARSGFGKPLLVSFDLQVTAEQRRQMEERLIQDISYEKQIRTYGIFIRDMLDRAAQALWDNPEIAPIGLRGRALVVDEETGQTTREWDLRDVGFEDEIARPADAYRRYGSPRSDPAWRP